jgi:hypothetical protein
MTVKNMDLWRKVAVRDANGDVDYAATKAELKEFCTLMLADQCKVRECLESIFQECRLHQHITKPNLQSVVCSRLGGSDMSAYDELRERVSEVIAKHYTIERKSGVLNPYYAPDSRAKATMGNAR